MLDIETLRLTQAAVALVVFLLVRYGSYRHTGSPYARGWSWVVVLSAAGSASYFLAATPLDGLAAPLGNALSVASAALVWLTARRLRGVSPAPWIGALACVAVAIATVTDGRTDSTIPGTPALLAGMAMMFILATREIWKLALDPHLQHSEAALRRARPALWSMVGAATCLALFYSARLVAFAMLGPDSPTYVGWAGPGPTTLVILILLVVVTFTVTELSRFEATTAWQLRASRDDLTDLLTRHAFEQHYVRETGRSVGRSRVSVLVIADLDNFKDVNDRHGHDEGDRVLVSLAAALRETLAERDVACRWGGDEFVVHIADGDAVRAQRTLHRLNDLFALRTLDGPSRPTVSYGIAHAMPGQPLAEALEHADRALRGAKDDGRSRIVVSQGVDAG